MLLCGLPVFSSTSISVQKPCRRLRSDTGAGDPMRQSPFVISCLRQVREYTDLQMSEWQRHAAQVKY